MARLTPEASRIEIDKLTAEEEAELFYWMGAPRLSFACP